MKIIENSKYLYQPPMFNSGSNWYSSFSDAIKFAPDKLTIDIAAIHSFLAFGFVCGNRTLIKEVTRQPWLSKISKDNEIILEKIPEHGFRIDTTQSIAIKFYNLLLDEARNAIKSFEHIYVLLSGGLDSRIVAGILNHLYKNNELNNKPIAITWGIENSRDVVYAREIAKRLNFDWQHIPINPEIIIDNIHAGAEKLGLIHSPEMLHNMLWFNNIPENSLILAGSFGDSIGRAEFGGIHLLQLKSFIPNDKFKILKKEVANLAKINVLKDINNLYQRNAYALPYMQHEYFMQGYRMRGGLCHALSVINNNNVRVYQMFTHPEVYSFIWSLHPSKRDDDIYAALLEKYFPELARIPWARTNKALSGKTSDARKDLLKDYHKYTQWSKNELREQLENMIDIDWYNHINIFDIDSIVRLSNIVRQSNVRVGRTNNIWLWLAGFKIFIDFLEKHHKKIDFHNDNLIFDDSLDSDSKKTSVRSNYHIIQSLFGKSHLMNISMKKVRIIIRKKQLRRLKKKYLIKYPAK